MLRGRKPSRPSGFRGSQPARARRNVAGGANGTHQYDHDHPEGPCEGHPRDTRLASCFPYTAISGMLGASVSLGVGELFSGFYAVDPLAGARGRRCFRRQHPGDATDPATHTLGTNDKPFLLTTIVVASCCSAQSSA